MFWCDGELVPDDVCPVGIADRGLLLGDGLFETLKVRSGKPLFLTEHLSRLAVSAKELSLPVDRSRLRRGVGALLEARGAARIPVGSLRITVTRGPAPRGLAPIPAGSQSPVSLITFAPSPHQPIEQADALIMAPFIRSRNAPASRMKTLSYSDNLVAKAHAGREGAMDALFLNEDGEVTCTTMANIFVKIDNRLVTPPLTAGILPGITREVILSCASEAKLAVEVAPLTRSDIYARPLYRTNSLMGVRPAYLKDDYAAPPGIVARDPLVRLFEDAEAGEFAS